MKLEDIVFTNKRKVKCEGQNENIGHPLVYLEIKDEQIVCPYCSRIFKYREK